MTRALQELVDRMADDLDDETAALIARAAYHASDDRLDLPQVIRLAAGPLIFLGGIVIGWRLATAGRP